MEEGGGEGSRQTGRVLRSAPRELAWLLWRTAQGSTVTLSPDAYSTVLRSQGTISMPIVQMRKVRLRDRRGGMWH